MASIQLIGGCDEVGRGTWAGPVFAAAVILDARRPIAGLRDSKKLSPERRSQLSQQIRTQALAWALGQASVEEIDRLNILQASLLAMRRAIMALRPVPDLVWVDGNQLPQLDAPPALKAQIGGDDLIPAISAASIIAKVERDELMQSMEELYPGYGFAQHKGYGTAFHSAALAQLGPCAIHRQSFAPVRKYLIAN